MRLFLVVAGLVWLLSGLVVLADAKSAIHEILACLALSFGVVFFALSSLIDCLTNRETKKPSDSPRTS